MTPATSPWRLRRHSLLVAAAVCCFVGAVFTGARAIVPNAGEHPPAAPAAVPNAKNTGPSGLPTPPPGKGQAPLGVIIDKTEQSVKKAKVTFNLSVVTGAVFLYAHPEQPVDPHFNWTDGTAYVYVLSPKGSPHNFGYFPTAKVGMLAFGSIPVSARVHIRQITTKGKLVPLVATVRFTGAHVQPPKPLPCSPPQWPTLQCFYTDAPHLTGPVDVRIDDLAVDGVPVDVGPDCHTAQPATLALTARAGYYSNTTVPPYIPPGLYQPFVGGTLHGPVNVPGFTGCHNGADDLDRLITGMVSGPGNNLSIHQLGGLGAYPPKVPK